MRPRHRASENVACGSLALADSGASMRPRHRASENLHGIAGAVHIGCTASMRPRHRASENVDGTNGYVFTLATLQ